MTCIDTFNSTISGILAMKAFRRQFIPGYTDENGVIISPSQSSQIVSILSAGTFFGSLLAAPLGDRLGRRISLIISVVIFSLGVVFQTAAMQIPLLVAGRYVHTMMAVMKYYAYRRTDSLQV